MKKTTLAAQGTAGIAALALLVTFVQADSVRYSELSEINIDIENAALAAVQSSAGEVIEIELELDDKQLVWEVDIVNEANEVVTVEVDGKTGAVISTELDDDTPISLANAVSLAQAIEIVKAVEQGAIVEAELESDDGELIWEVESINADNQETKFRVNAQTGEILI